MDQPVFILTNAVASYIGRRRSNNNRAAIVCHLLVTAMAIPVALVPACWPLFLLAETVTSDRASAACYRSLEDFGVVWIVVAELEFRDVERQIFGADLVERADDATLEDRPKAFNRIRVHSANNVLAALMVHALVLRIIGHSLEHKGFVGREQANLVGYHFAHERLRVLFGHPVQNAGDDITLALDSPNDRGFTGALAATATAPLAPVAIVVLTRDNKPADYSFVSGPLCRKQPGQLS
jgi:hypothetical protein